MPTLIEISTRISQNLGSPDYPTVGVINFWLRNNLGVLNNLLNTSYVIDGTDGSIEPDIGEQEAGIFQSMYYVYYYSNKVRENLGAASIDSVLEVSENGALVRLTNKNEISKSYIQMKKQEQEDLNKLVTFYRSNHAVPGGIDGDDSVEGYYNGVNSSNTRIRY